MLSMSEYACMSPIELNLSERFSIDDLCEMRTTSTETRKKMESEKLGEQPEERQLSLDEFLAGILMHPAACGQCIRMEFFLN